MQKDSAPSIQPTLHLGDSKAVLPTLPDSSVHSIVTDPPYELGFMGKKWDASGIANDVGLWRECLRVLTPGGHLLAFGGSRTYHRMACAIEDAGFKIRDQIMWLYGSGFPKSHNLAGEWEGWGTALKPAHEPIVVARKPLSGTVVENVQRFGTGALNIDGCRVATDEMLRAGSGGLLSHIRSGKPYPNTREGEASAERTGATPSRAAPRSASTRGGSPSGRWPSNVIHDGSAEVRQAFPDAPGQQGVVTGDEPTANGFSGAVKYSGMIGRSPSAPPRVEADRSAARFFYCPKTSRKDRDEGCENIDKRPLNWSSGDQNPGSFQSPGTDRAARNHHPTVKPTELMRYLCRLVTPPGGVILDPFMGSGSTGKAAVLEGFRFIGIEREAEYFEIATARVAPSLWQTSAPPATAKKEEAEPDLFSFTAA